MGGWTSGVVRRAAAGLALAAGVLATGPASAEGDLIGEPAHVVTREGETLLDIARAHDVGVPAISAVNPGVDPWVPPPETLLTLPTAHLLPDAPREGLVINYAELRLYWFPPGGGRVRTFPIGIGRDGFVTPVGRTTVVRKQERPTWRPTASTLRDKPWVGKVVPPGPDNPLGEHAVYLGWPTYLVHGTNKPYGVGRRVSRGCIRMYPEDVAELYRLVDVGTPVAAVRQPVKFGRQDGELYLEAHPDAEQVDELEATQTMTPRQGDPEVLARLRAMAGADAERVNWTLAQAELTARRGVPVRITGVALDAAPVADAAADEPVTTAHAGPTPLFRNGIGAPKRLSPSVPAAVPAATVAPAAVAPVRTTEPAPPGKAWEPEALELESQIESGSGGSGGEELGSMWDAGLE